jgi:hypothetical protein
MTVKTVKSITLLREIKEHNQQWFAGGNKRFFGDVNYKAYYGKATGNRYLVRATFAWSDMFGQPRKLHYRINPIGENFEILPLIDTTFRDIFAVKDWLRVN